MMVDKEKSLFWELHDQNLRLTRLPIPSSGSLVSTVIIVEQSEESATKFTFTCKVCKIALGRQQYRIKMNDFS